MSDSFWDTLGTSHDLLRLYNLVVVALSTNCDYTQSEIRNVLTNNSQFPSRQ